MPRVVVAVLLQVTESDSDDTELHRVTTFTDADLPPETTTGLPMVNNVRHLCERLLTLIPRARCSRASTCRKCAVESATAFVFAQRLTLIVRHDAVTAIAAMLRGRERLRFRLLSGTRITSQRRRDRRL